MSNSTLTVIKVAKLIDGSGGPTQERMALVLEGSSIQNVCTQDELLIPEGANAEVLEFQSSTLVPGLIDCHTHTNMPGSGASVDNVDTDGDDIHLLQAVNNARLALESGVTTIRDNGGWNKVVFSIKEGIHRNLVPGPHIVASGRPITITGGHMWMMGSQADGVAGVRKEVRRLAGEGADFIKVVASGGTSLGSMPEQPSYSLKELEALVDEAHLHGLLVGAHAHATQAIVNSLDAGVDMLIHCTFIQPDGTIQFDQRIGDRVASSGTWVNPTLYVAQSWVEELEAKREMGGLTKEEERRLELNRAKSEDRVQVCSQLIEAGASVIGGSDCGFGAYPFGHFDRELNAMVQAGLSSKEALLAGTKNAAKALNLLDTVGTVAGGKTADLLIVSGDPTNNIGNLRNIVAVFHDGIRIR